MGRTKARARRAQSIVEYLVIVTLIIIALFAVKKKIGDNMNSLFNKAENRTAAASNSLGNINAD